jgi:hypothetical protein
LATGLPDPLPGVLTASAATLPAAVAYHRQSRRRNPGEDIALLQRGELRRPIGLVVTIFVAAVLAVDSIVGVVGGLFATAANQGPSIVLMLVFVVLGAAADFFIASYASHYLGRNPYWWIAAGVGIVFVIRMFVIVILLAIYGPVVDFGVVFGLTLLNHLIYLGGCLFGTWYGTQNRQRFFATKIYRAQQKLSWEPLPPPPIQTFAQTAANTLPPPNPRDRRLE